MSKIAVADGGGVRKLTIREGLRIFGYPDSYEIPVKTNFAYDLLGNTVAVPVLKAISERVLDVVINPIKEKSMKFEKTVVIV
jgi:DNA (cytosine-5)-methyltransferase 1